MESTNTHLKSSLNNFKLNNLICLSYHVNSKGKNDEFGISDINKLYASLYEYKDLEFNILQKCNCTEIYLYGNFSPYVIKVIELWKKSVLNKLQFHDENIRSYRGLHCIKHLIETSVGVHSVTLGDSQVLSQVKQSVKSTELIGYKIPILAIVFKYCVKYADIIRSESQITKGNTSVSRIAAELISNEVPTSSKLLIVGAGETAQLLIKCLNTSGFNNITVSNRTSNKADELVEKGLCKESIAFDKVIQENGYSEFDLTCFAINFNKKLEIDSDSHCKRFYDLCNPKIIKSSEYINLTNISDIALISRTNLQKRNTALRNAKSKIKDSLKKVLNLIKVDSNKHFSNINFNLLVKDNYDEMIVKTKSKSLALNSIRNFLTTSDFTEVITPSITAVASDPVRGANKELFQVNWYGKKMYLRQSNQLYKQILIQKGFNKIFEIGTFWREEINLTPRHTSEALGLDIEIFNPSSVHSLINLAHEILKDIAENLIKSDYIKENPFINDILILEYSEIVELLSTNNIKYTYGTDFGYELELSISNIIKKKFNVDFYAIIHYPKTIKKFYTQSFGKDFTDTFDIIFRGWEISSGALRQLNTKEMKDQMSQMKINYNKYKFYMDLLQTGRPHGGFCLGIDRILTKIFNGEHINEFILFPRTNISTLP